jgi:hypothetical protein
MFVNHRLFRLVVCAAGLLALSACSAAPAAEQDAAPAIGSVPRLLESADLRLPVQDYLASEEQNAELAKAKLVLIRQCMSRFGVDYAVEFVPSDGYGPRSLTDRRYGITDLALAQEHGYGLGPRDPALQPPPVRPELGPDGQNALSGQGSSVVNGVEVPEGGCLAEADRALETATTNARLGQQLQRESFQESRQDSRVRSATKEWSSCMAEAGYRYTDPFAAAGDPRFIGGLTDEQIAVAVTDIDCKSRTNLVGIWFTVESAYQNRYIEQNAAKFEQTREAIAARHHEAEDINQQN